MFDKLCFDVFAGPDFLFHKGEKKASTQNPILNVGSNSCLKTLLNHGNALVTLRVVWYYLSDSHTHLFKALLDTTSAQMDK